MTYQELRKLFYGHEDKNPSTHLTAYITFSNFGVKNQSFYTCVSRSYIVYSDYKAFKPEKGG